MELLRSFLGQLAPRAPHWWMDLASVIVVIAAIIFAVTLCILLIAVVSLSIRALKALTCGALKLARWCEMRRIKKVQGVVVTAIVPVVQPHRDDVAEGEYREGETLCLPSPR